MKKTLHYSIKILSVLTFCFFTYAYTAPVLYAQNTQTDYTVLAPLPGTTNSCPTGTDCTTNFKTYLEGMFTFAIGVSAVLAFIMLSFAGFQYVTTDGIGGKSNAKERIENAVYGLLLVIGAYAILYTINPDILKFNLNIIRPNISSTDVGITATSCGSNCTSLSSIGIGFKDGGFVAQSLGEKLSAFNNDLKSQQIKLYATEAYPPTGTHQDPCHNNGTCIDAIGVLTDGGSLVKSINNLSDAAAKNGLSSKYEVTTQAKMDEFIKAGVNPANIMVNTKSTGEHYHIRLK